MNKNNNINHNNNNNNNNCIIVTALFDINRDKFKNQRLALKTIDEYYNWFKITLQINCPMVIYTEEKTKDFILKNRPIEYKTDIVIQRLEDIPYYKYKDKISQILASNDYKIKMDDLNRIECNLPEYTIIQYSKFDWLKDASDRLPFGNDSNLFFWMDAGCSRFFEDFDLKKQYPGPKTMELLENIPNKLFCQCRNDINISIQNPNFFYTSNNLIYGTLFGGNKSIIEFMSGSIKYVFEDLLNKNIVNNEQLALAYIYSKAPNNFNLYMNISNKHLPIFLRLSN